MQSSAQPKTGLQQGKLPICYLQDDSTSTKALQCPTISLESCSEPSTQQSKPPQPAAQPPDMPSPLAALTGKALAAALALLRDPAAFGHLLQLHLQTSPQQQQQQPQQTADPLQALLQAAVQQREADNTSNPAADLVSGTFAAQLEPELAAEVLLQLTEVLLAELAADSGVRHSGHSRSMSLSSGSVSVGCKTQTHIVLTAQKLHEQEEGCSGQSDVTL